MFYSRIKTSITAVIAISLICSTCKPKNHTSHHKIEETESVSKVTVDSVKKINYQEITKKKLGEKTLYKFNETNEYVICYTINKPTALRPNNNLKYIIFNIAENEILDESQVYDGNIEWSEKFVAKIKLKPEMIQSEEVPGQFGYYFNVIEQKRKPIE